MNILVFDIETIPDTDSGRKIYQLDGLSEKHIANILLQKRRESSNSDFLPPHLHKIVAISAVLSTPKSVRVWSLGEKEADEAELVTRFFDGIERFSPTLVSWNGSGFDLPVLHYRALLHGIVATRYWEIGLEDNSYKYNNYLNRYHWRHIDLMDILSAFQMRAAAPLDQIALMLGFPGKLGMSGDKVWDAYQSGALEAIRNYCETDVLNTYLVYLRFEYIRGNLDDKRYEFETNRLKEFLTQADKQHLAEFLEAWESSNE